MKQAVRLSYHWKNLVCESKWDRKIKERWGIDQTNLVCGLGFFVFWSGSMLEHRCLL
jgi:hypothetical protein